MVNCMFEFGRFMRPTDFQLALFELMMNGCRVLEFFQYYKSNKMGSGLLELGSKV